jgi:uncharacterized protein YycO
MGIPFSRGDAYSRGKGRRYVIGSVLEAADIIVSTSTEPISKAIRDVTVSPVSHAALYLGQGVVVGAIDKGARARVLAQALKDSVRAIAYRHRESTTAKARRVCGYANDQIGRDYDFAGAMISADPKRCGLLGSDTKLFCSELAVEEFNRGGLVLTGKSVQCSTPDDVFTSQYLDYVGHLK